MAKKTITEEAPKTDEQVIQTTEEVQTATTEDPTEEISVAREILSALAVEGHERMDIVSCPTCGRTRIDLIAISREFEERVRREGLDKKKIKVALMGCAVNGPNEARHADYGIAGGIGEGYIFKKGELVKKVSQDKLLDELEKTIINDVKLH